MTPGYPVVLKLAGRRCLVVGGGQAGLATGYHLRRRGADFVILEAHERIGESWRRRWDTLRVFTPARNDGLPGLPFPAPGLDRFKPRVARGTWKP